MLKNSANRRLSSSTTVQTIRKTSATQPMPSCIVRDIKDGAILTVHVQPKAAKTACVGTHGEALKIRIAAAPVDGAANRELIRFLADEFSLPMAAVHIVSGESSRLKLVRLKGMTAVHVMTCLLRKGATKA
jgi:hypothetical protein